jgi:glycyl-tRNA synthetase beta chain
MVSNISKEEWALIIAHKMLIELVDEAVKLNDYSHVLNYIAIVVSPILDNFFKEVRVNDGDPDLRMNRLRLMKSISKQCLRIADFSKL